MLAQNWQISPVNRKEGPAALTNKKQHHFDQIHAGNLVMQSCVRFYPKKNVKINFLF
jgi:hypothetical protein